MKKGMTIGAIALLAVLAVGLVVTIFVSVSMKKNYEKQVTDLNYQVKDLEYQVQELGQTETCYQLAHDVKSGTEIKETDLVPVEVPLTASGAYEHDMAKLVGKYYKINFKKDTTLSADMVYNMEITKDMRYLDVVCDQVPIGLEVDDYVDVRVSFTLGQDFILMTHKRVAAIYGNTVKLMVDNKDIYSYESAKVDKAIYKGVRIYTVEFVEGGVQGEAIKYYPLRVDVLATLVQDPNIDGDLEQYTYEDRTYLESQLALDDQTMQAIESGKNTINQIFQSSVQLYDQYITEQKQKQQQADQQAQQQAADEAQQQAAREAAEKAQSTDDAGKN